MEITMIGVDYTTMPLAEREKYALSREQAERLGNAVLRQGGAGAVVLSTCNRTELWASGFPGDLPGLLLAEKPGARRDAFKQMQDGEAIEYLFRLAAGMESQIFGEDQILSQVKTAATLAREAGYSDSVLETLFRTAVTSAKKIKTNVVLTEKDRSVPGCAIETLEARLGSLRGKRCMVIGNGEMGKLTAELLVERGCNVTVTIRNYKRGEIALPGHCRAIMYDKRYELIPQMDLVFSATLSPHHTVKRELLEATGYQGGCVFVDLALPRDIDETVGTLRETALLDMDSLDAPRERDQEAIAQAERIMGKYRREFYDWYAKRDAVGDARTIGRLMGEMTERRLIKRCAGLELAAEERAALADWIGEAVQKTAEKVLFAAKKGMEEEQWRGMLATLRETAEELDE